MPIPPQISVHDKIDIKYDQSALIIRTYTFENIDPNNEVVLNKKRIEAFPADATSFKLRTNPEKAKVEFGQPIHLASGEVQYPWKIGPLKLDKGESHVVEFSFRRKKLLQIKPPIEVVMEYSPRDVSYYSSEINSVFPIFEHSDTLIEPPDSRIGGQASYNKLPNKLSISQRQVSTNKPFRLTVKSDLPQNDTLPLLQYYCNEFSDNKPFNGHVFLIILHLLNDFLSLMDALEAGGMDTRSTYIVGIPYSWKHRVIVNLMHRGYKNIKTPTDYPFPFLNNVKEYLSQALKKCEIEDKKLIILEDGGYAIPLLYKEFQNKVGLCVGGVEQTMNGIWQYQGIHKHKIKLPTINVAECELKKKIESPLIGDAVVKNIDRLLNKRGLSIISKEVLLVGYGSTGEYIAQSLKNNNAKVTVYDKDVQRRKRCIRKGYRTGNKLTELVRGKSIIIGATGKNSMFIKDILNFEHNTILVNASSKKLEFDQDHLRKATRKKSVAKGYGTHHTLINSRTVTMLANGFPVNFFDSESVADQLIQFIVGLLLVACKYLMKKTHKPGFVKVPKNLQKEIKDIYDPLSQQV